MIVLYSLFIPFILGIGHVKIFGLLISLPILVYVALEFENKYRFFFVFSLFFGFYLHADSRIQLVNIVSYALIIYFYFNYNSDRFNKLKLPVFIRLIAFWLVLAVLISSIKTPFVSFWSIYYFLMFFIYILTGYVVFRSVLNLEILIKYLDYFYKSVTFFGIFILLQIVFTGVLRSNGLSGPTIPDMISMALLIVLFKSYISSTFNKSDILASVILFVILITTLSRFAWLGFLSSFVFGLLLVSFTSKKILFSKRTFYIIACIGLLVIITFVTGLHTVIISRFLDVDFTLLESTKDEAALSNSLDTRILIWTTALNAFMENSFSGVGYFMFHKVSFNYNILPEHLFTEFVMGLDPHSTFLGFLTETGLFGFAAFFSYLMSAFILCLRTIKLSNSENSKSISIILCILMFFLISTSFYSGAFTFGYNAYALHFIVALVIANYAIVKKARSGK